MTPDNDGHRLCGCRRDRQKRTDPDERYRKREAVYEFHYSGCPGLLHFGDRTVERFNRDRANVSIDPILSPTFTDSKLAPSVISKRS